MAAAERAARPAPPVRLGSADVLLAELEVWHSRPGDPDAPRRRSATSCCRSTRRPASVGCCSARSIAEHLPDVDDELVPDIHRLLDQISRGDRIAQPRLRHRYQVDRHGLAVSVHRLEGEGDNVHFDLRPKGSPLAQVLGAIYAVERLDMAGRLMLVPILHRAMRWRGPIGPSFVANLAGAAGASLAAMADPRAWALDTLGFPLGTAKVSKKEVTARYRDGLRRVHPDHGGDEDVGEQGDRRPPRGDAGSSPRMTSLLLFPGAGADRDSPSLVAIEQAATAAIPKLRCVRADFPYRKAGRRAPDRPPVLLQTVRDEATALGRGRLVLGGRSMGGRICSMAVGDADAPAAGGGPGAHLVSAAPAGQARHACASSTCRGSTCRACSSPARRIRSARPTS